MVIAEGMTMNITYKNIMVIASPFDCAQDFASNHATRHFILRIPTAPPQA